MSDPTARTAAATRERVVRSIERSLTGLTITRAQADRIARAAQAHATAEDQEKP